MQGNYDSLGSVMGSFNYRLSKRLTSKNQVQLSTRQDMATMEQEYTGEDFTASVKSLNPSFLGGGLTGVVVGQYFQSVTPKLALGVEATWQRMAMNQGPEANLSYFGRYKTADWVATGSILGQGALTATYWRRLSEKVQVGTEMQLQLVPSGGMMGGIKKEGLASVGGKCDFRLATLKAQVDSKGKLSMLMEKRMPVPVILTFATEVDYAAVCVP